MPAQVEGGLVIHDMPVDAILLSESPPGLGHCFQLGALSYLQRRRNRINMGVGMKGDMLTQMQHSRIKLPLRSCIKHRTLSVGRTSNGGPVVDIQSNGLDHDQNQNDNRQTDISVPDSPALSLSGDDDAIEKGFSSLTITCDEKVVEKKRVSFADTMGFSLQTVKYMDGPSSEPPKLRFHLLQDVIQNEEAKPTHPYTYVPGFEQPASNYLEFRSRLENENLCLENVMVKDNITIVGTIKVKNIAFEKSVFVRATFDEWKTHQDIPASYASPTQGTGTKDKFDTFSFTFDMPPNISGRNFEFCICYNANCQSFWDNNQGNNYKFVTHKTRGVGKHEEVDFQNMSSDYTWGQFSYWQATQDHERPYW